MCDSVRMVDYKCERKHALQGGTGFGRRCVSLRRLESCVKTCIWVLKQNNRKDTLGAVFGGSQD